MDNQNTYNESFKNVFKHVLILVLMDNQNTEEKYLRKVEERS